MDIPDSEIKRLGQLLKSPRGWRHRLRCGKSARREECLDAIRTLQETRDPVAIVYLLEALFDSDSVIRCEARTALESFGEAAVPHLASALRFRTDWTLDGMQKIIDALGTLQDKRATGPLTAVLFSRTPLPPTRWWRHLFFTPLWILGAGTGALLLFSLALSWNSLPPLTDIIAGLVMLCTFGLIPLGTLYVMLLAFVSGPTHLVSCGRERKALTHAAIMALHRLQDKRALPMMVTAAFSLSSFQTYERNALWDALVSLLPLVNAGDTGLFKEESLVLLTRLLGDPDARLVLAVVRAMEFVGTGQAAESVERLTRRGATQGIRDEARRILPILQARRQQALNEAHLLRASSLPTQPEQLLRPAAAEDHTPSEQLLRPG